MKRDITLLFIPLFWGITLCISCVRETNNTKILVKTEGLSGVNESFSEMVFLNETVGYLFGKRNGEVSWQEDGSATSIDTAIIYTTINGGKSWKPTFLDKGHSSFRTSVVNGEIYALNDVSNDSPRKDLTVIYKLNKEDGKWNKLFENQGFIRDLIFLNKISAVVTMNDTTGQFFLYKSDLNSRKNEQLTNYPIYSPLLLSNKIFSLYTEVGDTKIFRNVLMYYDLVTRKSNHENLPTGFDAYQIKAYNNQLYLVGLNGIELTIYKRTSEGHYDLIHKFVNGRRNFPKVLHIFGNRILLLTGERESIFIKNHLYLSNDAGKTWSEKQLENNLMASPIAFFNDKDKQSFITWIYSGSSKIQVLDW